MPSTSAKSAYEPSDLPFAYCYQCETAYSEVIVTEQRKREFMQKDSPALRKEVETWQIALCPTCALAWLGKNPTAVVEGRT